MQKIFLIFGILILFILFSPKAYAQNIKNFKTTIHSSYAVDLDENAKVNHEIEITNRTDFLYAPSYSMQLEENNFSNLRVQDELGNEIPFEIQKGDKDLLLVLFTDKNAGKGNVRRFTIQYKLTGIGYKKGSTNEISIPGLLNTDLIDDYMIDVQAPREWGGPSIVKPSEYTKENNTYSFSYKNTKKSGVLMIFGEAEYYEFKLRYHLKNPNIFPAEREIALPPNTSYQKVLVKEIKPYPSNIHVDEDGNWLAKFLIPPGESKDINVRIFVKIEQDGREKISQKQKKQYTKQDAYWEKNDKKIQKIAKSLSDVRDISDFVVDALRYDFAKDPNDTKRYGAKSSLNSESRAVCLEFSDLFIAIARSKGIPARSVEGYAYTSNAKSRPLSLAGDVLHAWPEYYDEKKEKWIMIDPTWTDTTGGLDYFSSLDFDHVAFVIKGINSRYPIPAGAYKISRDSKDIQARFISKNEFTSQTQIQMTPYVPSYIVPLISYRLKLKISNTGSSYFYGGKAILESGFFKNSIETIIPQIPPGGEKEISVSFQTNSFLTKRSDTITMRFEGQIFAVPVTVQSYPSAFILIIGGLAGGIAGAGIIIAIQTRNIFIHRKKG